MLFVHSKLQRIYLFLVMIVCFGCQTAPKHGVSKTESPREVMSALGTAFNIQDTGVKYCPVDGKRYSSRLDMCPEHKVKLLLVE